MAMSKKLLYQSTTTRSGRRIPVASSHPRPQSLELLSPLQNSSRPPAASSRRHPSVSFSIRFAHDSAPRFQTLASSHPPRTLDPKSNTRHPLIAVLDASLCSRFRRGPPGSLLLCPRDLEVSVLMLFCGCFGGSPRLGTVMLISCVHDVGDNRSL